MTCVLVGSAHSHPGVDVSDACCESVDGNGNITDSDADVNLMHVMSCGHLVELCSIQDVQQWSKHGASWDIKQQCSDHLQLAVICDLLCMVSEKRRDPLHHDPNQAKAELQSLQEMMIKCCRQV